MILAILEILVDLSDLSNLSDLIPSDLVIFTGVLLELRC